MTPPITTVLQTTAFDAEARADPYPRLRALQAEHPVFRDEIGKVWFLSRYEDVRATVSDRTLKRHPALCEEGSFTRRLTDPVEGISRETDSILFLDDPDHARVRTPLAKALYARVAKMKPRIEGIVGEVLDRVAGRASFDLMAEVAIPVPILVIARVLGVDEERLPEFREWSEAVILGLNAVRTEDETRRMVWGSHALSGYFTELMEARRKAPRDDLVSDMVALQGAGAPLSDAELRVNLGALLVGGNLTTSDLIGNGVWLLLTHPDQLGRLRRDPSLAAGAVEEILRYESPVDITGRVVPDERTVAGCPMRKGHSLMMSLRAANRDPSVFSDPDRFDIGRTHAPHVAFGGGAHICIGAPLARLEAQAALVQIVTRFPGLRLAQQELQWRTLPFFRGLQRLEVET